MKDLAKHGLETIPELVSILINNAMQVERAKHLKAKPYEHSPDRSGYANGYKPKTVKTNVGETTFDVPQVRNSDFYPTALEKGMRSERALNTALAEMYILGVSTRKVKAITEMLCGYEVSAAQVSGATEQLDEVLRQWRDRDLGEIRYLFLDARYEKVREVGQARDSVILTATGICPLRERQVLGVSVSLSEHETHWKDFLISLKERGLKGTELVISDDHAGLEQPDAQCLSVCPGRDVSFICSKAQVPMCPGKP
jgi:transposase-like protein